MLSIPWKETLKHQTNFSPCKSTFAFSKDKRFKNKDGVLCDSFYNIPTSLGRAPSAGMGRGNKTSIVNPSTTTPSPLNYSIKSSFETEKKGIKFALGRENIKSNGIFTKSQTPQPGHYQIMTETAKNKGFTIYSKFQSPELSSFKNPGPGHYKSVQSLNSTGRYVLSQLNNCPGYKIKPNKQKGNGEATPGPGQYQFIGQNLNPMGKYTTSNHQNSRCRTFSKSSKNLLTKRVIPGPGSYNYYSQFGTKA